MLFFRFIFIFKIVLCLREAPDYKGYNINDAGSPLGSILSKRLNSKIIEESVDTYLTDIPTVTTTSTLDFYRTSTYTYFNSLPLTITEFVKSTITLPTYLVIRTSVNDDVKVETPAVTETKTETVTDVLIRHSIYTDVSTEIYSVIHLNKNILQTTATSTIVRSLTFRPTLIQTVISTKKTIYTETVHLEDTIWIDAHPYFNM